MLNNHRLAGFTINLDERVLRESETYQQLRHEINQRNNPSIGKIDWDIVHQLCSKLGKNKSEGIDFLAATYHAVSSFKKGGITELAAGLELQLAVFAATQATTLSPAERRCEVVTWMIKQIKQDLSSGSFDINQLRELYRCEQACQELYDQFMQAQPNYVPDLEVIGFIIFEHIDKIERMASGKSRVPSSVNATKKTITQPRKPSIQTLKTPLASPTTKTQPQSVVKVSANSNIKVKNKLLGWTVLLFGILLGVGGTILVNTYQKNQPNLFEAVSTQRINSKVLTASDVDKIKHEFTEKYRKEKQSQVVSLYIDTIKSLQAESHIPLLTKQKHLINSIQLLYPNDQSIKSLKENIIFQQEQLQMQSDNMQNRFLKSRTQAANIKQIIESNQFESLKQDSINLANFAMSLSPIYGRIDYIQTLINDEEFSKARNELESLNSQISTLSLQSYQFSQKLIPSK